jgi:aldehyde dehydrogenase (NAD+)
MTTLKECHVYEKNLRAWLAPRSTPLEFAFSASLDSAEILREPLGTVLIIGTWNYPVNTALVPLIGALAAGNTVVLKLSEVAENTGKLLAVLIKEYLSADFCRVVYGAVQEATALLTLKWDHIFYTGIYYSLYLLIDLPLFHNYP